MVEQQIRPWNVSDPDILALLGRMHREDFVPADYRNLAFSDLAIPLRQGAAGEGQALLAPKVEARILHDLHVQPHESVLEVGTGSGFMAALLGQRARQPQARCTFDKPPKLMHGRSPASGATGWNTASSYKMPS